MDGTGYSVPTENNEATTGNTFQEYDIESINATIKELFYPCCPSEPWPIASYWVYLDRSSFYYYNAIIVPGITFVLMSFFSFWLSHEVGERLGFCVTLILATEISKVVIAEIIPVCGSCGLSCSTWSTSPSRCSRWPSR
jgi:hypothetical protein